jgi:hypothetical protein
MEPATVFPMDLDVEDADPLNRNDELEDIHINTQKAVEELKYGILQFKKEFFIDHVSNDSTHDAKDMGAMMNFHARFLQILAYWIGLLDNKPVPMPRFTTGRDQRKFKALTYAIETISKSDPDAHTLVYSLLFHFAQQHPFDLGQNEKNKTEE